MEGLEHRHRPRGLIIHPLVLDVDDVRRCRTGSGGSRPATPLMHRRPRRCRRIPQGFPTIVRKPASAEESWLSKGVGDRAPQISDQVLVYPRNPSQF